MRSDIDQSGSGIFYSQEVPCFDHHTDVLSKITRMGSLVFDEMVSRTNRSIR